MTTNTSGSEASPSSPFSALGEALEAAAESIGDARADATASAKLAAAKVQLRVSTGAYFAAYGVSYGLVFSGVFLTELLPTNNPVRRGLEAGAAAAIDAAANRIAEPEDLDEEQALEDGTRPDPANPIEPAVLRESVDLGLDESPRCQLMANQRNKATPNQRATRRARPSRPQCEIVVEPRSFDQGALVRLFAELKSIAARGGSAIGEAYARAASTFLNGLERLEDANAERRFRQRSKEAS